ncbi:MAG: HD domain-containing protein [Anaerolineaceae bacterium]
MVLSFFDSEELGILQSIQATLPPETEVFLVGGAVRDLLLKRSVHDFDFVLKSGARKVGKRVANALKGAFMMLDEEREISRVILTDKDNSRILFDFSVFRADSLDADLRARDFTINAMAVSLTSPDKIIDPLGGMEDLRTKKLKICSSDSFQQDSLRTVRAVRMAVEFNLRMTEQTIKGLKPAVKHLPKVSAERLRDEFFKILEGRKVSTSLRLMDQFGILPHILPELEGIRGLEQSLPHEMDVWQHTLAVVDGLERLTDLLTEDYPGEKGDNLTLGLALLKLGRFRSELTAHFKRSLNPERSRRGLLMLAGLYHDIGKGVTLSIDAKGQRHFYTHEVVGKGKSIELAYSLVLSNIEAGYLQNLVKNHMRIHLLSKESGSATHRAIYRYFRDTEETGIDICLLSLADILSRRSGAPEFERWNRELSISEQLMDSYWNHTEERVNPPRLVDGEVIMSYFKLPPGKLIGGALEAVREAQACGQILDREEALKFAGHWLEENRAAKEGPGER